MVTRPFCLIRLNRYHWYGGKPSNTTTSLGVLSLRLHQPIHPYTSQRTFVHHLKSPLYSGTLRWKLSLYDVNLAATTTVPTVPTVPSEDCSKNTIFFLRKYSSASDGKKPQELGILRRGWMRFAGLIKAFMTGTKALYQDMKRISELRQRGGKYVVSQHAPVEIEPGKLNFPFRREELQFIYQVSLATCTS